MKCSIDKSRRRSGGSRMWWKGWGRTTLRGAQTLQSTEASAPPLLSSLRLLLSSSRSELQREYFDDCYLTIWHSFYSTYTYNLLSAIWSCFVVSTVCCCNQGQEPYSWRLGALISVATLCSHFPGIKNMKWLLDSGEAGLDFEGAGGETRWEKKTWNPESPFSPERRHGECSCGSF